jgi:hypothetical protein
MGSTNTLVGLFVAGNLVACRGTISDGTETGTTVTTSITIENTAPEAPVISIVPAAPIAGEDDLVCNVDVASYDVDGDSVTYSFDWEVDGGSYGGTPTTATMSSTVPGTDTNAGETWTCTVTPNDGTDDGASSSTSVVIEEPAVEGCWSLDFDGVDDAVVVDDNPEWAFGTDDFAIITWAKIDDINGTHQAITGQYELENGWQMYYCSAAYCGENSIYFGVHDGSWNEAYEPWTPEIGEWHQIAVVRQSGTFFFYIDGVELGSTTKVINVPDFNSSLNVGVYHRMSYSDVYYLDGSIDSIHIWNRALSDSEINTYLSSDPTGSEADLLSLWSMNEGSGITAGDSSGGSNDGTIDGATWVNDCPEEPVDADGDGYVAAIDCDDDDSSLYPYDLDGDGYSDGCGWVDIDGEGDPGNAEGYTCGIGSDLSISCWGTDVHNVVGYEPAGEFVDLDVGEDGNACAVNIDGSIACWGDGHEQVVTDIPAGVFGSISCGLHFCCAIDDVDTLTCWGATSGWSYNGQSTDYPAGTYTGVSAGVYHACARTTSGEISCWGSDEYGGSSPPAGPGYIDVGAGYKAGVALDSSGEIGWWGLDDFIVEPPLGSYDRVYADRSNACALDADGYANCWNYSDNPWADDLVAPPTTRFRHLGVGQSHVCGVTLDGHAECWGNNDYGACDVP